MASLLSKKAQLFLDLLASIQPACMAIVTWVKRFAPLAVFGLLAQETALTGLNTILGIAVYVPTVFAGCNNSGPDPSY